MKKIKHIICNNRISRLFIIIRIVMQRTPEYLCLRIVDSLLSIIFFINSLLLTKYLLQALKERHKTEFITILLVATIIEIIVAIIRKSITPHIVSAEEKLKASVMTDFLSASLVFNMEYFSNEDAYNKYTMVFEHSCSVYCEAVSILVSMIAVILELFVIIFILSWMDTAALIILFSIALIQTFISNKTKKRRYHYFQKRAIHSKQLNYIYRLFWSPEHMMDLRANSLKSVIYNHKENITRNVISETFLLSKDVCKCTTIQSFIVSIESLIMTAYLGYKVLQNVIWFDTFVVSQSSYSRLKKCVSQMQEIYSKIYENDFYTRDYLEFIGSRTNLSSGSAEIDSFGIDSVIFDNVSFAYPNSATFAIESLSFTINRGDKVFVIGKNGTGKTTIIKLLLRLYEPNSGNILINGKNIKEYSTDSLQKNIGVLFQSCPLYAFSIKDILCCGENHSNLEIEEALKKVGLWEKVSQFPLSIDTPLTNQLYENGIDFSGGERQRIALARLFLKKNSLWVLDEPTSNLDSEIEKQIFDAIFSSSDSTAIIVSHELGYAEYASKIIRLDPQNC